MAHGSWLVAKQMSTISSVFARTSSLMMSQQLLSRLHQTQLELFDAQTQMTTGKQVSSPSDDPSKVSSILFLKNALSARAQTDQNLSNALSNLNNVDAALSDATDVTLEAKTIALSQIGVGSDAQTRQEQAIVVDSQIEALMDIANRKLNGLALFAGTAGSKDGKQVFEPFLGGIRYNGSTTNLTADVGRLSTQIIASNGLDAFGSLSTRVQGDVDLDPQASATVRLADINGASGNGISLNTLNVDVNGIDVTVDLANADTLGDVVTRINDAIDSVSPGAGTLSYSGDGFALTGLGANTITISEIGSGRTASDLGLDGLTSTGGVADVGSGLNIKISEHTLLADLGAAVDFAGGLQITQGQTTKTADFSTATTVGDLIKIVKSLDMGVRLDINSAGDGLNLVTEVSGINLSVGENGGSTAEDLGIRTYGASTLLSNFRDGQGIEPVEGEDDFEIQLHDGTTFSIDATGLNTVSDLISAIQTAATGAGLTVGVDFDVALASTGNGLTFTDNTAGASDFVVRDAGTSLVATQLGIAQNAGAAASMTSADEAQVRVRNLFTDLMDLRDALTNNDESGITLAGSRLEDDLDDLAVARAIVGVESRRVTDEQERSAEMKISEQSLLSEIQDADLTEVITRFSQLQTQLQASLQAGAYNLQLSLMDFLR